MVTRELVLSDALPLFALLPPSASSAGAVRGVSGAVKHPESLFLSFSALNPSQAGLLLTQPETQPLPVALPAAVVPEPRSDGGSQGPILVACVRLQESEGRAPWAAGIRERMEPEAGDYSPAFRNVHSNSGEMKLRKRKSTQYVSAQEKRSRRPGECWAHCRAQGTWDYTAWWKGAQARWAVSSLCCANCACTNLPQSSCLSLPSAVW